jgi:hypothetical protein
MKGRVFLLFLLTVALLHSAPIRAQIFSNPVRIPTPVDPYSVFAVDLNGDGLLDLLYGIGSVNSIPGSMNTLIAQPSGGYAPGPVLTVPVGVGACRPSDVNHDGKLDLVCINYLDACDSEIAVFLGNGDGSFQNAIFSGLMQSNCLWDNFYPELYAPADLNSDSYPDLTVGDTYNFELFVLLGDGTGHFTVSSTIAPASVQFTNTYVADLNGDRKPDLVSSYGPWVYLGNGDGTFSPGQNNGNFGSCNLHDMEGNGHLDAVCVTALAQGETLTGANQLAVLHGNPDGTFNPTPIASQTFGNPQGGAGAIESPTAIVDVNGDGIPDIVAYSPDGLSVLLGQPNLQFAAPVHYAVGNYGAVINNTSQLVDLNGYPDIVATGSLGLYISYGNKNGMFSAPPAYPVASLLGAMTVGDFNGDGIPDIAATGDNNIELSLGNGDGTFQPPVALPNGTPTFANGNFGFTITHGDFRGTGRQDILAIGSPGTYDYESYVLFNNGGGSFSPPLLVPNSTVLRPNAEQFGIADFNGDHRDDVLTTSINPNSVSVGLSNGDGTFNTVTTVLPNTESGYVPFPAVADFNKDGKIDLAYLAGSNLNVMLGNGDGTFNTNAQIFPIPPYQGLSQGNQPLGVATGDFDGDGNTDIAVLTLVGNLDPPSAGYSGSASALYVFYGNGDGTFSAPVAVGSSSQGGDTIYAADVNKDGRDDLIIQATGTEAIGSSIPGDFVEVFLSEPDRLFGPAAVYEVGWLSSAGFVADVNGDGYPDLLISNSSYWESGYSTLSSNSVTELLNLGPATNSAVQASNTALTASATSFVAGTSVTFTATVTGAPANGNTPTGSVRFADQTGIQSTVPLVLSGSGAATATFTTNDISPGKDTMGAAYLGDGAFGPSFATASLTVSGLADTVAFNYAPKPCPSQWRRYHQRYRDQPGRKFSCSPLRLRRVLRWLIRYRRTHHAIRRIGHRQHRLFHHWTSCSYGMVFRRFYPRLQLC